MNHFNSYAPVLPVGIAKILMEETPTLFGDYHLLLAHDVVKKPAQYESVYKNVVDGGGTIIMDNSVAELGKPVDMKMMEEAVAIVNANVVTLPDAYLDGPTTFDWVKTAMDEYAKSDILSLNLREWMVLPQGKTWPEWIECAHLLSKLEQKINIIGIPRNVNENLGVSRVVAGKIAEMMFPTVNELHMFGFSNNIFDDMDSAVTCCCGIDSAVPIRAAMQYGKEFTLIPYSYGPRDDWWDNWESSFTEERLALCKRNIQNVRDWLSG